LQNVISNYNYRGIETRVPSIIEIQNRLAAIGNKPNKDYIGTTSWIEPPNCDMYLTSFGYASEKFTCIPDSIKEELDKKLYNHFITHKTPIIIDDSIKAYSVVGVRDNNGIKEYLRFDPHTTETWQYTSKDKSKIIACKGVDWMTFEALLYPISRKWMFCLPTPNKVLI